MTVHTRRKELLDSLLITEEKTAYARSLPGKVRLKVLESYHSYLKSMPGNLVPVTFWRYEAILIDVKKGESQETIANNFSMPVTDVTRLCLHLLKIG